MREQKDPTTERVIAYLHKARSNAGVVVYSENYRDAIDVIRRVEKGETGDIYNLVHCWNYGGSIQKIAKKRAEWERWFFRPTVRDSERSAHADTFRGVPKKPPARALPTQHSDIAKVASAVRFPTRAVTDASPVSVVERRAGVNYSIVPIPKENRGRPSKWQWVVSACRENYGSAIKIPFDGRKPDCLRASLCGCLKRFVTSKERLCTHLETDGVIVWLEVL